MKFEIILAPEAQEDLKRLSARIRRTIRDAIETHLRYEPTKISKSRIKRLRGLRRPQYRIRSGDIRIFYDVDTTRGVEGKKEFVLANSRAGGWNQVLAIVAKSDANAWLQRVGESE